MSARQSIWTLTKSGLGPLAKSALCSPDHIVYKRTLNTESQQDGDFQAGLMLVNCCAEGDTDLWQELLAFLITLTPRSSIQKQVQMGPLDGKVMLTLPMTSLAVGPPVCSHSTQTSVVVSNAARRITFRNGLPTLPSSLRKLFKNVATAVHRAEITTMSGFVTNLSEHGILSGCPGGYPCCLRGLKDLFQALGLDIGEIINKTMEKGMKGHVLPSSDGKLLACGLCSKGLGFYRVRHCLPGEVGSSLLPVAPAVFDQNLFNKIVEDLPLITVVLKKDGQSAFWAKTPLGPGLFHKDSHDVCTLLVLNVPWPCEAGWAVPALFSMDVVQLPSKPEPFETVILKTGFHGGEDCYLGPVQPSATD